MRTNTAFTETWTGTPNSSAAGIGENAPMPDDSEVPDLMTMSENEARNAASSYWNGYLVAMSERRSGGNPSTPVIPGPPAN